MPKKVNELKNKIEAKCPKTGLPNTTSDMSRPAPMTTQASNSLVSKTSDQNPLASTTKPYFADLQPVLPGRRRSSLVKP